MKVHRHIFTDLSAKRHHVEMPVDAHVLGVELAGPGVVLHYLTQGGPPTEVRTFVTCTEEEHLPYLVQGAGPKNVSYVGSVHLHTLPATQLFFFEVVKDDKVVP